MISRGLTTRGTVAFATTSSSSSSISGCVNSLYSSGSVNKKKITCSHADLLAWGLSSPELDAGVSKSEMNRMKTRFYNAGQRRCTLCNEYLEASFSAHCGYVGHMARVGILERAVSILQKEIADLNTNTVNSLLTMKSTSVAQKVQNLVDTWWKRLNETEQGAVLDYKRIAPLSAPTAKKRLWRVRFLLEFLRDREVIRDSLSTSKSVVPGDGSFVRTKRFERSEMIGDNIVKVVVPDRLTRLFPANEGGVTYKLGYIQQLLDSNEGLLQIYDYIDLDTIIGVKLPNNKTKSDVVESLFGELQTFLWASEIACGISQYPAIPNSEHRYVKALVEHLMNELTHMVIMWRIETTLENAKDFLEEKLQRKLHHQQSTKRSESGAIIIKESECDRHRYALLPLLLPFSYLTTTIAGSGGTKATGASEQHFSRHIPLPLQITHHIQKKGTPLMLFDKPLSRPSVMVQHYRGRMRVVQCEKIYNREVLQALSNQHKSLQMSAVVMTSSLSNNKKSSPSNGMPVREVMKHKMEGHQQQQQQGIGVPWGELAAEKYPTWSHDVRISSLRQCVDDHLTRRGVYLETVNWNDKITTLARDMMSRCSIEMPVLQNEPMRRTEKTLRTRDMKCTETPMQPVTTNQTLESVICEPSLMHKMH
ncbi:putative RNA editing complex protein MP67 [Trypanosoma theileri]|uniref:Putative RNA editing complex protein MP67 n=1 Tax=Trypanosoma theileri TaxID=67003 RepID=A0A1X0P8F1_9TRYP|nr:putative RNA editing complex protein MP67 [Trypanosoma theileri]ORC93115.1 putative RNA editing complex protein MP67 [Trypanosoma theileri]